MRDPRDDDELDAQLYELREPARQAALLGRLIATGSLPHDTTKANALVQLGWYLSMQDDWVGEGECYRAAVADGGRSHPDARCYLAEWHMKHGDSDEGRRLFDEVWRGRPDDYNVYLFVGEVFEELDDLASAIRWFTAGAMRSMRDDDETETTVQILLMARRRARLANGFVEDDYDVLAIEMRDELYGDPA